MRLQNDEGIDDIFVISLYTAPSECVRGHGLGSGVALRLRALGRIQALASMPHRLMYRVFVDAFGASRRFWRRTA